VSGVLAAFGQIANKPTRLFSAITVTAVLPLAGCGGLPGSAGNEPQQPAQSVSVSAAASSSVPATGIPATPTAGSTASGAPNGVPSDLGDPAATRNGTADGKPATLAVYRIRRSDTLAVLYFTVTVDPSVEGGIPFYKLFNDYDPTTGEGGALSSVDGVRLVDSGRRKLYLAASDGKGACLCSRSIALTLESGDPYTFYATYAAPPTEVTALDVSFPHFGTISHVPVQ